MDIPVKEWVPGKEYSKDDIVKVWNLALPPYLDPNNIDDKDYFAGKYVKKLGDDEKNYVVTDQQEYIATEVSRGKIFTEKTISKSFRVPIFSFENFFMIPVLFVCLLLAK